MSNLTITNVDIGPDLIDGRNFDPSVLTFAGAATVIKGTILARDSSTLKWVPFVKGGSTNENGIPKGLITHDVTAEGAGDIAVRVLIDGEYRAESLIIDADGDDSNIDAAVLDQLRDYKITAVSVTDNSVLDNQ